jgi:hypothetical protein
MMKKIIRILEGLKVDDTWLRVAPFALAGCRKESYGKLTRLCRRKETLMAVVVAGVIGLYSAKKHVELCKKAVKAGRNASGDSDRELNKYLDAIWRVYLLDTSIDKQRLIEKAIGYVSGKLDQELSHSLTEAKKEYKAIIQQIMGAVQAGTGHSENAVHGYLSAFLNSIGCTTLGGKRFTRQNISNLS